MYVMYVCIYVSTYICVCVYMYIICVCVCMSFEVRKLWFHETWYTLAATQTS
jgi:hypothetical protein